MRCLCNKVSDPLIIRQTLDFMAVDTNYLNIYSYICVQYLKQNRDMPTTKCKIKFYCKVYVRPNQKTNLIHLHMHLTIALILHSKVAF